ncbi:MAG: hypothetical protein U9N14_01610 [Pseudomonadota bacterium]|nr:hypothetical protein [Pseudomonadota bacterium]
MKNRESKQRSFIEALGEIPCTIAHQRAVDNALTSLMEEDDEADVLDKRHKKAQERFDEFIAEQHGLDARIKTETNALERVADIDLRLAEILKEMNSSDDPARIETLTKALETKINERASILRGKKRMETERLRTLDVIENAISDIERQQETLQSNRNETIRTLGPEIEWRNGAPQRSPLGRLHLCMALRNDLYHPVETDPIDDYLTDKLTGLLGPAAANITDSTTRHIVRHVLNIRISAMTFDLSIAEGSKPDDLIATDPSYEHISDTTDQSILHPESRAALRADPAKILVWQRAFPGQITDEMLKKVLPCDLADKTITIARGQKGFDLSP